MVSQHCGASGIQRKAKRKHTVCGSGILLFKKWSNPHRNCLWFLKRTPDEETGHSTLTVTSFSRPTYRASRMPFCLSQAAHLQGLGTLRKAHAAATGCGLPPGCLPAGRQKPGQRFGGWCGVGCWGAGVADLRHLLSGQAAGYMLIQNLIQTKLARGGSAA